MRIKDLLETATAGSTSTGSVAGIAMPFFTNGVPTMIRRQDRDSVNKPKKRRKDHGKMDKT